MGERKTYVNFRSDGTAIIRDDETDEKVGEISPGLIAAAPAMYEALRGIKPFAEDMISVMNLDAQEGGSSSGLEKWNAIIAALASAEHQETET